MNRRSNAALFLMEQIIVIIVFAICTAVCVAILTSSYIMVDDSYNAGKALQSAQSAAECFKASNGDVEKVVTLFYGEDTDSIAIYYDENWRVCTYDYAKYILSFDNLRAETPLSPLLCEISVKENGGGDIVSFTVAARREA